ncbi:MAG: SulP family inorganic anion transporter [Flavobacteriaceae bacterium]
MNHLSPFKNLKSDIPASIVVFFVALPLCLGIALASGAPLFSGLIAGIVGGIVVGAFSGSAIGVSGPAAGLAAIVLVAISTLGGFENFLLAVVLGGIIQVAFGVLKAGVIGYYFPSSVIKGMLTGIGIIIVIKQIPYFFGYDKTLAANASFTEMFNYISPGATLVACVGLAILIIWNVWLSKLHKVFQIVQGPLVAVAVGIIYYIMTKDNTTWSIDQSMLVSVPTPEDLSSFLGQFSSPNFDQITNPQIWVTAFTIALVASLETLLCVEATDKLDPRKRVTPTNRELIAQGSGNIVSGLIGGLPITQVIVRSSANIQSGGRTKASAIIHGFLLLISVLIIPTLLNKIPLAVLAAVLFIVGYKLAKPALFVTIYKQGWKQFIPFIVTVLGIIFTDLLVGIGLGLAVGIIVILIKSYQNSHFLHIEDKSNGAQKLKMTLAEEVTFINKGAILNELEHISADTKLEIDVRKTRFLDYDIIEILDDFSLKAKNRNIDITLISERGTVNNPESFSDFFKLQPKV